MTLPTPLPGEGTLGHPGAGNPGHLGAGNPGHLGEGNPGHLGEGTPGHPGAPSHRDPRLLPGENAAPTRRDVTVPLAGGGHATTRLLLDVEALPLLE